MSRKSGKTTGGPLPPAPDSDGVEMDDFGRPIEPLEPEVEDSRDANDQRRFDKQKKAEERARVGDDLVVRTIMETREGRDWMYRRLLACHIFTPSAVLGTAERPSDPYETYFREGERNIGNRLLADVQRAAPDAYMVMIAEQQKKKDVSGG